MEINYECVGGVGLCGEFSSWISWWYPEDVKWTANNVKELRVILKLPGNIKLYTDTK